jgi:putative Mn2+ efflux pump MntP
LPVTITGIAFGLLTVIGGKTVAESFNVREDPDKPCDCVGLKAAFGMAVATGIDALIVGVTLAFIRADKVKTIALIVMVMPVTDMAVPLGVRISKRFGRKFERQAEFIGACRSYL